MFDVALCIARSFFRNHFAHCRGCRCTGTPEPSHGEKAICLVCDFFRWLEGHFQTRFHLHDFIVPIDETDMFMTEALKEGE